jgi:hypothetical protein
VHYAKIEVTHINYTCIYVRSQLGVICTKQSNKSHLSKDMYIQGAHNLVSMDMNHSVNNMSYTGQVIHGDAYGWVATSE